MKKNVKKNSKKFSRKIIKIIDENKKSITS